MSPPIEQCVVFRLLPIDIIRMIARYSTFQLGTVYSSTYHIRPEPFENLTFIIQCTKAWENIISLIAKDNVNNKMMQIFVDSELHSTIQLSNNFSSRWIVNFAPPVVPSPDAPVVPSPHIMVISNSINAAIQPNISAFYISIYNICGKKIVDDILCKIPTKSVDYMHVNKSGEIVTSGVVMSANQMQREIRTYSYQGTFLRSFCRDVSDDRGFLQKVCFDDSDNVYTFSRVFTETRTFEKSLIHKFDKFGNFIAKIAVHIRMSQTSFCTVPHHPHLIICAGYDTAESFQLIVFNFSEPVKQQTLFHCNFNTFRRSIPDVSVSQSGKISLFSLERRAMRGNGGRGIVINRHDYK